MVSPLDHISEINRIIKEENLCLKELDSMEKYSFYIEPESESLAICFMNDEELIVDYTIGFVDLPKDKLKIYD